MIKKKKNGGKYGNEKRAAHNMPTAAKMKAYEIITFTLPFLRLLAKR
jgi:hypothetical protein